MARGRSGTRDFRGVRRPDGGRDRHLFLGGGVQIGYAQWRVDGTAVCTANASQEAPTIVSDGAGGAIITWYDWRRGSGSHVYGEGGLGSGEMAGAGPIGGRGVCAVVFVGPQNPLSGVTNGVLLSTFNPVFHYFHPGARPRVGTFCNSIVAEPATGASQKVPPRRSG